MSFPGWVRQLIIAIVVGIIVAGVCFLVGTVLGELSVPIFSTIGRFMKEWAVILGFLAFVLYFLGGTRLFPDKT